MSTRTGDSKMKTMKSILSRLAPPVAGKSAIREHFQHRSGEIVRLIRGLTRNSYLELLREAFPGCCEGCVGATMVERCEVWNDEHKKVDWRTIAAYGMPRYREADGVLCRGCRVRLANESMERFVRRAEALGCCVDVKVRYPKTGSVDGYLRRWGTPSRAAIARAEAKSHA